MPDGGSLLQQVLAEEAAEESIIRDRAARLRGQPAEPELGPEVELNTGRPACAGFVWFRWWRPSRQHCLHERWQWVPVWSCVSGKTEKLIVRTCCRCGKQTIREGRRHAGGYQPVDYDLPAKPSPPPAPPARKGGA